MSPAASNDGKHAQRKTPKGATKGAFDPGRTRSYGKTRENLPNVGDAKNGAAGL
jgi:hypothetical protein